MNEPKSNAQAAPAGQPHDPVAERAVLGALLVQPRVIQDVGNMLAAEDFFLESNRCVFRAMLAVDAAGDPIDSVLVVKKLRELDLLETSGGGGYLAQLSASVPTAANVKHYANIVKEKAVLREVLAHAIATAQAARGEVEDVSAFVDDIAQQALGLSTRGVGSRTVHIEEALKPAIDLAEKLARQGTRTSVTGVPTGYHALDRMTSGWQPSDLIILAARPGMGKTAFALNMLVNAAKDRRGATPGVIFSLEMSKEQLASRLWCAESRVPMEKLRSGDLDGKTWDALWGGVVTLKDLPIYIDDTPALPIAEMMRKCRQLKHEHDIGVVMVDYLQLMTAGAAGRGTSREQVISEISRNLKALAKELQVPVIALSQLNRSVESRPDKRPLLSDLRESGAIEQDADIICFLYRDDYYKQMKGEAPGGGDEEERPQAFRRPDGASVTEVILAKHRSGATGKVELNFHAPYTLFTNLSHDDVPPPGDADAPPFQPAGDSDPFG